jgi:tryptophan-rich hypothetical protein
MPNPSLRRLNQNKLLLSKWTAATPKNKEKHFLVTQLIKPEAPDAPIEHIEMEVIYSRRSFTPLRWKVTESIWQEIIDTKLKGAFFCAQVAARHMANNAGGSIINICLLSF